MEMMDKFEFFEAGSLALALLLCISTIVFSGLKIINLITLPWWVALAPIWVPLTIIVTMWLILTIAGLLE